MPGEEFRFPSVSRDSSALKLPPPDAGQSRASSEEFNADEARSLHDSYQGLHNRTLQLAGFLDRDREFVRRAGAEATVLECVMILNSEKIKRLKGALTEAAVGETGVSLSNDGLDRLSRLERLVSEAETRMMSVRFIPQWHPSISLGDGGHALAPSFMLGQPPSFALGQPTAPAPQPIVQPPAPAPTADPVMMIALVLGGTFILGLSVIAIIALSGRR